MRKCLLTGFTAICRTRCMFRANLISTSVQIARTNCGKFVENLNYAKFTHGTICFPVQISCNNFVYKLQVCDGKPRFCGTVASYTARIWSCLINTGHLLSSPWIEALAAFIFLQFRGKFSEDFCFVFSIYRTVRRSISCFVLFLI